MNAWLTEAKKDVEKMTVQAAKEEAEKAAFGAVDAFHALA